LILKKQLVIEDDIVYQLKAIKNPCEIQGMKEAHVSSNINNIQSFKDKSK
jgi:Xaa-Pro aminopeptidase